jgi:hypothetical protein
MDSFKDHLLILDEAQMGKKPGIAMIHHAVNANDLLKKHKSPEGAYVNNHRLSVRKDAASIYKQTPKILSQKDSDRMTNSLHAFATS